MEPLHRECKDPVQGHTHGMWLNSESGQGKLAPKFVLLTSEVHCGHSWVSVFPKAFLLQILDEIGHLDFLM